MVKIRLGILSGFLSGVVIGFFLKIVQFLTNIEVYTLLLNMDFIYSKPLNEPIEFSLHILVSIFIGVLFTNLSQKVTGKKSESQFILSLGLTLLPILLYFPLTFFAVKQTPELTNGQALFWWTMGHLVYAVVLPLPQLLYNKKNNT
ncbi:hypothetical protein CJ195_20560 [Bacillus sp. UMB0899]|nr:hypothetical protein CJ195_20560 [Bacillus sp. UMB0899]